MDCEVKVRKAHREFSGAEYVRNGPPGPELTLLRSMPLTIGLVVGAQGGLSRSVKKCVFDCAEKGSISPERFGCCHGQDQARGMIAKFINRAIGRVSLLARRGLGLARDRSSALLATRALELDDNARGRGRAGLDLRPAQCMFTSPVPSVSAGVARNPGPAAGLGF